MTRHSKGLAFALWAIALGHGLLACGDDDDGPSPSTDASAGSGGQAGRGGSGGRGGMGGSGGSSGNGEAAAGGDRSDPTCQTLVENRIEGSVDTIPECLDCLCDMKDAATKACTPDCWKLAYCVAASGCGTSDTACIRAACTERLGGMEKYMAAAVLAVAVPFQMCTADCFGPIETDDGGFDAGR